MKGKKHNEKLYLSFILFSVSHLGQSCVHTSRLQVCGVMCTCTWNILTYNKKQ